MNTVVNDAYLIMFFLTDTAGAGHGGRGGMGTISSYPGQAYGSVTSPQSYGSGSAATSGGGIIRLEANHSLTIDGLVTAEGQKSSSNKSGGGSGGSVWLSSQILTGNGIVSSSGGSGYSTGSGGGGRIAVDFRNSSFAGKLQAFGGRSKKYSSGGAGTIVLYNYQEKTKALLIDNNNIGTPTTDDIQETSVDGGRTWLTPEINTSVITFDVLNIRGKAQLAVQTTPAGSPLRWEIKGIQGDRSGILHVRANQKLKMTTSTSDGNQPGLMWGVNVYERGDLTMPENLVIDGIKVIESGSLSGANNVTVGNGGKFILRLVEFVKSLLLMKQFLLLVPLITES